MNTSDLDWVEVIASLVARAIVNAKLRKVGADLRLRADTCRRRDGTLSAYGGVMLAVAEEVEGACDE